MLSNFTHSIEILILGGFFSCVGASSRLGFTRPGLLWQTLATCRLAGLSGSGERSDLPRVRQHGRPDLPL